MAPSSAYTQGSSLENSEQCEDGRTISDCEHEPFIPLGKLGADVTPSYILCAFSEGSCLPYRVVSPANPKWVSKPHLRTGGCPKQEAARDLWAPTLSLPTGKSVSDSCLA